MSSHISRVTNSLYTLFISSVCCFCFSMSLPSLYCQSQVFLEDIEKSLVIHLYWRVKYANQLGGRVCLWPVYKPMGILGRSQPACFFYLSSEIELGSFPRGHSFFSKHLLVSHSSKAYVVNVGGFMDQIDLFQLFHWYTEGVGSTTPSGPRSPIAQLTDRLLTLSTSLGLSDVECTWVEVMRLSFSREEGETGLQQEEEV